MNARTCVSYKAEQYRRDRKYLPRYKSFLLFIIINILAHTHIAQSPRIHFFFCATTLFVISFFFVLHYLTFAFYLTTTTTTASCTFVCKMSFNKSNAANFTLSLLNINVSVKYKIILVWYIKAATSRFLHIFKYTCDTRCDIIILHTTSTRINVK